MGGVSAESEPAKAVFLGVGSDVLSGVVEVGTAVESVVPTPRWRASRSKRAAGALVVAGQAEMAAGDDPFADEPDFEDFSLDPDGIKEERLEEVDDTPGLDTDLVRTYLKQIGKTPLLNAKQEVDLAKQIEAGLTAEDRLAQADAAGTKLDPRSRRDLATIAREGVAAKNHLIEANLRLVVSIAKRYRERGMPFLDLIQQGNLGLIRAVEKFDHVKGYKFSTYATWWIRQAITRGMGELVRIVRLPVHVGEEVAAMVGAERRLTLELGREPLPEELAGALGIDEDRLADLIRWNKTPISLDSPLNQEDGGRTLGDSIADTGTDDPSEFALFGSMRDAIDKMLRTLPEREATVIRMRFGLADGRVHTLEEIGKELSLSRERIRQIEEHTIRKMRSRSTASELEPYA